METSTLQAATFLLAGALFLCGCSGDLGHPVSPTDDLSLWRQSAGPYGGFVNEIMISDGGLLASTGRAIYRLSGDGTRWNRHAIPPVPLTHFTRAGATILAGSTNQGVFRSTDDGSTWSQKNNGLTNLSIYSCTYDSPYVLVGTYKGVFRSSNSGETWTPGGGDIQNRYVVSLLAVDSLVLAGTYDGSGIFCSTDYGRTWSSSNAGLANQYVGDFAITGGMILAGATSGVCRSIDGGKTWADASRGIPDRAFVTSLSVVRTTVFAGTNKGIYCTGDAGTSWTKHDAGRVETDLVSGVTEFHSSLFAASHSGVFRSDDGGVSWSDASCGIAETRIADVAAINGYWIAMTSFDPAYRSTDHGKSWRRTASFASPYSSCWKIYVHNARLYGTSSAGLFYSSDAAATWVRLGINGSVMAFAAAGSTLFAAPTYGVCRSTDEGVSWSAAALADKNISALAVLPLDSGTPEVFAAAGLEGLYRTTDAGVTWTPVAKPRNITTHIFAIGTTLFAYPEDYSTMLFRSTDHGASWTEVYSGVIPSCLAVHGRTLYAGAFDGSILQSADDGQSWQVSSRSLSGCRIMSLYISDSYLIAATEGTGVWTFRLR